MLSVDQIFLNVLDKHAPLKCNLLRANHSSYISKPLRKAIMKRYYLEKVNRKNKSKKALKHIKSRKTFAALYQKERTRFFNNLNPPFFTGNKLCSKTINYSFQTRKITDHKLNSLKKTNYYKTMNWLQMNQINSFALFRMGKNAPVGPKRPPLP